MKKVAIVTDSEANIDQEGKPENLFVVPMPFIINGEEFYEGVNIDSEKFYEVLLSNEKISTSQPSYEEVTRVWKEALSEYDELVHIPLSSGLSSSCASAKTYAEEEFKGKVFVADNQRVSVTQKTSVMEALRLAKEGKSAAEICKYLEDTKTDNSIYITIPTLKYLKRGGRITPAAAALGTLLNIKPILQIQGDKLDSYAKVLNMNQAKVRMINAIKKDIETRFSELKAQGKLVLEIAHTNNLKEALKFKEEVEAAIPDVMLLTVDELSLSVACHIGPGSLALAVSKL